MKAIKPCIVIFCLVTLLSGYTKAQDFLTTKYAPEQLREDLNYFLKTAEEIHPKLYHSVSRDEIYSYRRELEAQMTDSMTAMEFGRLVIPLSSKFMDGHTSLWFPYHQAVKSYSTVCRFPLSVKIEGRQLFVAGNYSADHTIEIWDEIIEINGQKSGDLIEELLSYINGELEHWRLDLLENNFSYDLWLFKGWEKEFKMVLKRGDFMVNRTVQGLLPGDIKTPLIKTNRPSNFSFSMLDEEIGLIDFRSMNDSKRFKRFLDSSFQVLNDRGAKSLIIDVRENGGGNSNLAKSLFDYIYDKPYKMAEKVIVKTSRVAKESARNRNIKWYMYPLYPLVFLDKGAHATLVKKDGSLTEITGSLIKPAKNKKNRFKGSVYLLTGNKTFSSAHMLASSFSCYNMGITIGAETGQPLISYGELVYMKLPNTRCDAWSSSKSFYQACADSSNGSRGVIPDYEVVPTVDDLKSGRDAVMDFTLDLIRNNK